MDQVQRTTNAVSSKYNVCGCCIWVLYIAIWKMNLRSAPTLRARIRLVFFLGYSFLLAGCGIWDITVTSVLSRAHLGWNKGRIKSLSSLAVGFPQEAAVTQDFHPLLPNERAKPQCQLLSFPESTELGLLRPPFISHECPSKYTCSCLEAEGVNSLESDWKKKCVDS